MESSGGKKLMNEWSVNTRWLGFTGLRHNRVLGGPRVWTIFLRVGRKKPLA